MSSDSLQLLVDACAPLWAGEAELIRAYWDWEARTRVTDLTWIARQCHKELFDGVVPRAASLADPAIDVTASETRLQLLRAATVLRDELAHFTVFADLYDALRTADDAPLNYADVERRWAWPENEALRAARHRHAAEYGRLGALVEVLTEGGLGALFAEGARLAGRGGVDDRIAAACARVHEDEIDHVRAGLATLSQTARTPQDWMAVQSMATEQLRCRIEMRAAQFSFPVPAARQAALCAGAAAAKTLRVDDLIDASVAR